MDLETGLHHMPAADVDGIRRELEASGWRVFVLPEPMTDRRGFFDGVRRTIPLDPPVLSDEKWDALSDSLWSGLDGLDAERIAVIWPASMTMAELAPEDFDIAQQMLADIGGSLADGEATAGEPTQLVVVLT
jgi:hypothetical protein